VLVGILLLDMMFRKKPRYLRRRGSGGGISAMAMVAAVEIERALCLLALVRDRLPSAECIRD